MILRLTLIMLLLTPAIIAAQPVSQPTEPTTKLEDFVAQDGVVIIRGFSFVGELTGLHGTSIEIESKEFTNAVTRAKQFGITIEVKETSRLERDHTSYIDYDEVDSLVRGLDYIRKVDKSATSLDDFQADYRTRGDFQVSTFSSSGTTLAAVKSGSIGGTSAYLNLSQLGELKQLLKKAKTMLDALQ